MVEFKSGNVERGICAIQYVRERDRAVSYIPVNIIGKLYVSNGILGRLQRNNATVTQKKRQFLPKFQQQSQLLQTAFRCLESARQREGWRLRREAEALALKTEAAQAFSGENETSLSPENTRLMLHELRVHQIELEMKNDELRRTQVELEAARIR